MRPGLLSAAPDGASNVLVASEFLNDPPGWDTSFEMQEPPPSGGNSAVECQLPKLDVAGSIPVPRSIFSITYKNHFKR